FRRVLQLAILSAGLVFAPHIFTQHISAGGRRPPQKKDGPSLPSTQSLLDADGMLKRDTGSSGSFDLLKALLPTLGRKRSDDLRDADLWVGLRADADNENEPASGEVEDPDARTKWFMFQRQYPFNEIPAD